MGDGSFLLRGSCGFLDISSRRVPLFRAGHWTSKMSNRCSKKPAGWQLLNHRNGPAEDYASFRASGGYSNASRIALLIYLDA
jgi:hypothetical protein